MSYKGRPIEIIEVENFLSIKKAKIDIRPITILIGENTTGKSVMSKLIYIIREGLLNEALRAVLVSSYVEDKTLEKGAFRKNIRSIFTKIFIDTFPLQYITSDNFRILYHLGGINILNITKSKRGIKVNFGRKFIDYTFDILLKIKDRESLNLQQQLGEEIPKGHLALLIFKIVDNAYKTIFGSNKFIKNIFIPHARTMYLYMGALDIAKRLEHFDYPMKEFLDAIEVLPELIKRRFQSLEEDILYKYLERECKLLRGELFTNRDRISIKLNDRNFDIYHTSSGQQELIPLVLLLRYALIGYENRIFRFSIEEPETHLFPTSQKDLTYLFGYMYNINSEFLITTHSPYILSALNNLLFAKKLYKEYGTREIKEKYEKIWIDNKDIAVYEIKDGYAKSIIDKEGLIEAEAIDKVSDEIAKEIDEMLELAYEQKDGSGGKK